MEEILNGKFCWLIHWWKIELKHPNGERQAATPAPGKMTNESIYPPAEWPIYKFTFKFKKHVNIQTNTKIKM